MYSTYVWHTPHIFAYIWRTDYPLFIHLVLFVTPYLSERSKELLRIASSSGRENPKLQELQSVLDEQYHYNSETKTILFVKTRALAEVGRRSCSRDSNIKG